MKTKVIAVMVVLSSYFCAASFGQSNIGGLKGGSNNNSSPSQPVNNTVVTPTPTPAASPNLFNNPTLNAVYSTVVRSQEYQAVKNKVVAKVNATKVGKKVSSFKRFLQRIGLAKKPVVVRKSS